MRKAGILLPIFSLPSKYGIGSLGKEAYDFIDFLVKCGQSVWQVLPITSLNREDYYSPYKTSGAFSGNPLFIDLDILVEEGLLDNNFINENYFYLDGLDPRYVDYDKVTSFKEVCLKKAFENYKTVISGNVEEKNRFDKFYNENIFWLDDYCKFMSLKTINDNRPYWEWAKVKSVDEIDDEKTLSEYEFYYKYNLFLQYKFFEQWSKLKEYANSKSIEIFGDIPIYVSQDSSDFFYKRNIFLVDEKGEIDKIAGVPPDEFSETGQIWGNPLYDWKKLKKRKYDWWMHRIKKSLELYDILRIDHFRGFESFYCIDATTRDAINGKWEKGPDRDFFNVLKKEIPNANIVAEDLGIITDDVKSLLEYTGFPGMKVIQFGFSTNSYNDNLPHMFYKNTVAYTGTHDNKTLAQWLDTTQGGPREYAMKYLRLSTYERYTEGFIRAVMASCSDLSIVPIQDWLDYGGWARINTPSTVGTNWKFRLLENELTDDLISYISEISGIYGRYVNR